MLKSKATEASNTTTNSTTLNHLPDDLIRRIGDYLPTRDMVALAAANKRFHLLFKPTLQEERAAAQLMDYVLKPTEKNVEKAKVMIAANPKIMFIESTGVEWASGVDGDRVVPRRVKGSPFKAALGTGDSELYNFMAQYLYKIVYKDENGEIIETGNQRAVKQLQEQFPNGFDYPPVEAEFTALMDKIVDALTNDPTSPKTQAVLNEFRHYFLPKEVTQGHHFNLNYLIEAINVYNENWDPWSGEQLSLFFRQVIGYLERLVPATDAQAFCQGLYYRIEQNQPPTRCLTLRNYQSDTNISYFAADRASTPARLGFDFGVYIGGRGYVPTALAGWGAAAGRAARVLKNYVEQKHQNLTTLNNTLNSGFTQQSESKSTSCAIL